MTGCSVKNKWYKSKVKHLIWNDLILYAKVAWERMFKYVKIVPFWLIPSLKASTKLGVLGKSFVDMTIRESLGVKNVSTIRLFGTLVSYLVEEGGFTLGWWAGVVLVEVLVTWFIVTLYLAVCCIRGAPPPLHGRIFLGS